MRLGEGLGVIMTTHARVNFVDTETRVQVCDWRDRWSEPTNRKCRPSADACCIVGIVNLRVSYERHTDARTRCSRPRVDPGGYDPR